METVRPLLRFCLSTLKDTLKLDLPSDHDASQQHILDTPSDLLQEKIGVPGPRRQQVEAAIAAVELWLELHGGTGLKIDVASISNSIPPTSPMLQSPTSLPSFGNQDDKSFAGSPRNVSSPIEAMALRQKDDAERHWNFNWADANLRTITYLERFSSRLTPSLDSPLLGNLVRRLDLRALDAYQCCDLISSIVSLTPNLHSWLLGFSPSNVIDISVLDALAGNAVFTKLQTFAIHETLTLSPQVLPSPPFSPILSHKSLTSNDQLSGKDLMGFIQEDLGKLKLVFGKLETLSVGLACFDPSVLAFLASSAQISLHKFEILPSRIQYSAQGAPEITDYLLNLFSSCQNLESVNLEGYLQFENLLKEDNAGLVSAAIGKNLLKLKAIRTPKNVTMDAKLMSSLLIGCTKLEDIALLGIPKASDPSSVDLVRCLMNNGQSLRNVSLGSETVMKENSNTAQGEAIALSEDSPHAMLEPCFFEFLERRGRSLRGLEIRGWSSSDRLLRAVAKHCSVLDLLILNPCFGVRSEAAIRDIITRTRTLRHLMLENTLPAASVAAELAHNEIKTRGGCVRMELDIGIVYA